MSDYQLAIQSPTNVFEDRDLQSALVEKTPLGMPKPRSGGFAVTYRMNSGSRSWAVRCFHRQAPDLESRYAAISAFLHLHPHPAFADFEYQKDGILVNGARFPIVKMSWVEGSTLGTFLSANADNPDGIASVAKMFGELVMSLGDLGVAHGDLQHGNVLVNDACLRLVDYDGMYVPGMTQTRSNELGHVNYQSPLRSEVDFDAKLDRFSAIVIGVGLAALVANTSLWDQYSTGENILFTRGDFLNPESSELLKKLRADNDLRGPAELFSKLSMMELDQIPTLNEALLGAPLMPGDRVSWRSARPVRLRQYKVVSARDRLALLDMEGERIEIVGKVVEVINETTQGVGWRSNRPYAIISFGELSEQGFRLMIWEEALEAFSRRGRNVSEFRSRWISVTGILSIHKHQGGYVRPQFLVEDLFTVRILRDESEASRILEEGAADSQNVPTRNGDLRLQLEALLRGSVDQHVQPIKEVNAIEDGDGRNESVRRELRDYGQTQQISPRLKFQSGEQTASESQSQVSLSSENEFSKLQGNPTPCLSSQIAPTSANCREIGNMSSVVSGTSVAANHQSDGLRAGRNWIITLVLVAVAVVSAAYLASAK